MKSIFRFFQKIVFTLLTIYVSPLLATAQSQLSLEETPEQKIAKKVSENVIEKAKIIVQEQPSQNNATETIEGILSLLSKTIEELEERAERQYQNNRYVFIRED